MAVGTKLNPTLRRFIEAQQMFFVATAAPEGSVNLSPKGMDTLRVLSDTRVVWLNLTGSGNETAAHLRESPRMTLMFMAMNGDARILRLYGAATYAHPGEAGWISLAEHFDNMAGSRQIFDMRIERVQISCGSGVPLYEYRGQRGLDEMLPYFDELGKDGVRVFWRKKNLVSIDGKPTGLERITEAEP